MRRELTQYFSLDDKISLWNPNFQVMWCYINYEAVLVVAGSVGLQVFDCDSLELRFSHACKDVPDEREHFARGLAHSPGDYLCVGQSFLLSGELLD